MRGRRLPCDANDRPLGRIAAVVGEGADDVGGGVEAVVLDDADPWIGRIDDMRKEALLIGQEAFVEGVQGSALTMTVQSGGGEEELGLRLRTH